MKVLNCLFKWMAVHKTLTKILIGSVSTLLMFRYFLMQEFNSYGENWNLTAKLFMFFVSFYVCFGIPWGFAKLKLIQFEQFSKIPFLGTKIYIILKIGLSCIIGTPVMIYELLKWIICKNRRKSENEWIKTELQKEKSSKISKLLG